MLYPLEHSMRLNLPVVDREYTFPPGQTLVSMTDLKGRITYCNPAFMEVSGYSREELIGQPHNLIRHPDMPPEAFRDLWATIAGGRPWCAAVKNRRKDGSYYWVMANVTPVLQGDRPVGYMSVRTHAARSVVEQAQALYARLREEQAAGRQRLVLQAGQVRRSGWPGQVARWLQPGLGGRLAGTAVALACTVFAAGWLAGSQGPPWLGATLAALALVAAVADLRRLMLTPLARLLSFCNRMAAGDLRQRLSAADTQRLGDVAAALNQLNVNLLSVVGDARGEADQLKAASAEIAAGNADLSARTEAQAASLEQTAASMEQITRTVQHSTESAQQAAQVARRASEVTQAGSQAVAALVETIQRIDQSSGRIGDIISVIEGIAFQTNLLALNAAVEAARAGEQGKGFGVVAGEVRALAQRTTAAARQIKGLIEDSGRTVQAGSRQAGEVRQTIEQARESVDEAARLMRDISRGASDQIGALSQVNEAVGHLDLLTQQNATMVQQVSGSAAHLQGRAEALATSVSVFQLESASRAADPAPA
jgi:aerotaxis receptor